MCTDGLTDQQTDRQTDSLFKSDRWIDGQKEIHG
jgi:hypothetical protein